MLCGYSHLKIAKRGHCGRCTAGVSYMYALAYTYVDTYTYVRMCLPTYNFLLFIVLSLIGTILMMILKCLHFHTRLF